MSISFLLAAVAFQPAHTAMSDIFGRKVVLYFCCLFFAIGIIVTMKAMRHRYIKKDQVCKADVLDLANPLAVPDKRPKLDRCLD
jgi:hypothetical protein